MIKRELSYEKFRDLESKEPVCSRSIIKGTRKENLVEFIDIIQRHDARGGNCSSGVKVVNDMRKELWRYLKNNEIEYFIEEDEVLEDGDFIYRWKSEDPKDTNTYQHRIAGTSLYLDLDLIEWRWDSNNILSSHDKEEKGHGFGSFHNNGLTRRFDEVVLGEDLYYKARFWLLLKIDE